MELLDVSLPYNNKIASAYANGNKEITAFFDYPNIQTQETYNKRLNELKDRTFRRDELADYLLHFHKKFTVNQKTYENIDRIRDSKSVVVIGGQQAGLLTGPLYTIHKIISILKLAKEQEERLNVPVLPVFWVAGEDHDFAEINHTYVLNNGKIKKKAIAQKVYKKSPASLLTIDKTCAENWIREIVGTFGETIYTKAVLQYLEDDLRESKTYVDFFIRIVFRLFHDQGLIIVDSGDEGFREIGSPFMEKLILNNKQLGEHVLCSQLTLKEMGYGEPIQINEQNAHLFFIQDEERILLENVGEVFTGKAKECHFAPEELLGIAKSTPQLLSNNVVTRPLMQEYVFPTLAFISGPGEVAYWAVLKKAFDLFGFKVPPVVPRLMITLLDGKTNKYIEEKKLKLEEILLNGCQQDKENWLMEQQPFPLDKVMEDTITKILQVHQPLKELALEIDPRLKDLAEKNATIIEAQIHFLKKKMEKTIVEKNHFELAKFDHIDHCIKPLDAPQERIWNIFYYINAYGFQFVEDLVNLDYKWNGHHKVILI